MMSEKYTETNSLKEALVFKGRVLPELPSHYVEPSSNNPLIVPYGAMPANPYADAETKEQQITIDGEFYKLYVTPPKDMPPSFVNVMVDDYVINETRRKMENYEAHMEFVASGGHIEGDVLAAETQRYVKGQASINEIADVIVGTQTRKAEFGKISHPYGYRMHYLDDFRSDMAQAITSHDGVVYPTISPYRSITILPKVERHDDGSDYGLQRIVGFIVKYKRDFGRIPVPDSDEVIHVVERQIAAFRVDEASGFDQTILASMHQLSDTYPKRIRWDEATAPHFVDRLARTGCKEYIETAVQHDSLEDFVVPISTTIYGFKGEHPVFGRIGKIAIAVPVEDVGIAYYGPEHTSPSQPLPPDLMIDGVAG